MYALPRWTWLKLRVGGSGQLTGVSGKVADRAKHRWEHSLAQLRMWRVWPSPETVSLLPDGEPTRPLVAHSLHPDQSLDPAARTTQHRTRERAEVVSRVCFHNYPHSPNFATLVSAMAVAPSSVLVWSA